MNMVEELKNNNSSNIEERIFHSLKLLRSINEFQSKMQKNKVVFLVKT